MRRLIMIHGRSQQAHDPVALKADWVAALHRGLAAAGIDFEIPDERIRLAYYGDTLDVLAEGLHGPVPEVVIKGVGDPDEGEKAFIAGAVKDAVEAMGIEPAEILAAAAPDAPVEKGVQNWPWVLAALRALDVVPGVGSAALFCVTHDVYRYLRNPGIQFAVESGVGKAFASDEECVVVAHSLGTVIAYNLLRKEAEERRWKVSSLITVGSPLAVGPIVEGLSPIAWPAGVATWFNAFDRRDVVALHPLDSPHFPVTPAIENYSHVQNTTGNRHGISGYLGDPVVARRIHDALLA
ncbi:hypothetical protein TR51_00150 [Kitasatospora griseola]|uniref:Serine peptidase n=1 Tax=Kitasatospora griseola TaxID=2064 RepID=A0A0D0Q0X6_KITGR|nr:hypothetical protein [Kitasatospora griseola]KIQ66157.1 hypothetical protein TR51_00150 [Kitasatospora griseola]